MLQPKNIGHAKILAENVRIIFFAEAGISFLHSAEATFLGGQQRSAAVHVDAAAFADHAAACVNGLPQAPLELLDGFGDDGGVFLVTRILGPAVKGPKFVGDLAGFTSNAYRA